MESSGTAVGIRGKDGVDVDEIVTSKFYEKVINEDNEIFSNTDIIRRIADTYNHVDMAAAGLVTAEWKLAKKSQAPTGGTSHCLTHPEGLQQHARLHPQLLYKFFQVSYDSL